MIADHLARLAHLQVKLEYIRRRRTELKHHCRMEMYRLESLQSKIKTEIDISFRELEYKECSPPKEHKRFAPDYVDGPLNLKEWYKTVCDEPLCDELLYGSSISRNRSQSS